MPEIKLPPPIETRNANVEWFVRSITGPERNERIVQVLTVEIPALWREWNTDADQDDLPPGLLALADALENVTNIEFPT